MTSSKDVIAVQDTAIKKISLQLLLSGEDDDSTGGMKRGGGGHWERHCWPRGQESGPAVDKLNGALA